MGASPQTPLARCARISSHSLPRPSPPQKKLKKKDHKPFISRRTLKTKRQTNNKTQNRQKQRINRQFRARKSRYTCN